MGMWCHGDGWPCVGPGLCPLQAGGWWQQAGHSNVSMGTGGEWGLREGSVVRGSAEGPRRVCRDKADCCPLSKCPNPPCRCTPARGCPWGALLPCAATCPSQLPGSGCTRKEVGHTTSTRTRSWMRSSSLSVTQFANMRGRIGAITMCLSHWGLQRRVILWSWC